jgi:hypothetical protein
MNSWEPMVPSLQTRDALCGSCVVELRVRRSDVMDAAKIHRTFTTRPYGFAEIR